MDRGLYHESPASPGISSGKLANLANSVSEKIEAGRPVLDHHRNGCPGA